MLDEEATASVYGKAMRDAVIEANLERHLFPLSCPSRVAQILDEDRLPGGLRARPPRSAGPRAKGRPGYPVTGSVVSSRFPDMRTFMNLASRSNQKLLPRLRARAVINWPTIASHGL